MITFNFKISNNKKLLCFKYDSDLKKYRGKDAINQLEIIKDYDFNSFEETIESNNNKISHNYTFIGKDIKVNCFDIYNCNSDVNMISIIKDIIKKIELNNIQNEKKKLISQKKLLTRLAIASSAVLSLIGIKNINSNKETKIVKVQEIDNSINNKINNKK